MDIIIVGLLPNSGISVQSLLGLRITGKQDTRVIVPQDRVSALHTVEDYTLYIGVPGNIGG